MEKDKNIATYRYHYIIGAVIAMALLTSLRFPIVFLDSVYWLTKVLYFVVSILVITYGLWLFQRLGMRYIAVLIIGVALLIGAINIFRFTLPFNAECSQTAPTKTVCFMSWVEYDSLTYANWQEVNFFYTVGDFPIGVWYRSTVLE